MPLHTSVRWIVTIMIAPLNKLYSLRMRFSNYNLVWRRHCAVFALDREFLIVDFPVLDSRVAEGEVFRFGSGFMVLVTVAFSCLTRKVWHCMRADRCCVTGWGMH